ncbi:MAG TPA: P1 family peptidase [Thermomicrobiales bacterium]|nr:P1 family peptidase [Thermomicrobiales bacterium]
MTTPRSRVRDLGIVPGTFEPGPHNAITDVPGIRVGQTTLHEGTRFHTGVTAIVPTGLPVRKAIPAGLFVGNGYGKLIGATQLAELGEIETPIILTGTLSAFRAADALVSWLLDLPGNEDVRSINPLVGETNDGHLSDIRARPITEQMVREALDNAADGPVLEGCVGAGSGTSALGFKAGIGTSSRRVDGHTIGAIVQANFSGTLTVLGVPIDADTVLQDVRNEEESADLERGNSCMIVVATDAPFDSRQLDRIARRAVFAMARVGAGYTHGSGDYGIAISTGEGAHIPDAGLDPFFAATMECVEEALLNSVFMAETTHGPDNHVRHAVPANAVLAQLRQRGITI